MNELYALTKWVQTNIVNDDIPSLYQQLKNKLEQNNRQNAAKVSFEDERDNLVTALRSIPTTQLNQIQIEVLKNVGIYENIGEEGASGIEDTLYKNVIDLATAHIHITGAMTELTKGIEWADKSRKQLKNIADTDDVTQLQSTEILIRVRFANNASISNPADLKEWSKIWFEIVMGITRLHGKTPESVKIISASKGSILISMIAYAAFARVMLSVINEGLKAAERYYNIQVQREKLREFKLKNDEIDKALAAAISEERASKIEEITQNVIQNIGDSIPSAGEDVNALKHSIEKLVDFIEKGGHVDFVFPNFSEDEDQEQAENDELSELRAQAEEVRKLEHKIKLLSGPGGAL